MNGLRAREIHVAQQNELTREAIIDVRFWPNVTFSCREMQR
jgi:hypothetical protein